jgi:hypothetical protein
MGVVMITRLVPFGEPTPHMGDAFQRKPIEHAGRSDGGADDEHGDNEHPIGAGEAGESDVGRGDAEQDPAPGNQQGEHAFQQRVQHECGQRRQQHDQCMPRRRRQPCRRRQSPA